MHLQPFRAPVGARTRHALLCWVLLLLAPACFALVTMSMMVDQVAITLTFGVPLGIWLGVNVPSVRELPARAPRAIRFAAGVSVTCLGLIGLFAFSAALAGAAIAAYAVTIGLTTTWGTHSGARPGTSAAHTAETQTATSPGMERPLVLTPDRIRQMTDDELCHVWRRSFVSLQQAPGLHVRALVVHTRQLLLDEVDARHPAGLRAWLSSGARPADGPDRFIGPTGGDSHRPEAA